MLNRSLWILTRTNTSYSHMRMRIAEFRGDRAKGRANVYQGALLCRVRTTIQVSRRAANDGIINITLPELRTTQPRTQVALQRQSDA